MSTAKEYCQQFIDKAEKAFDDIPTWDKSIEALQLLFDSMPDDYQDQFLHNNKHLMRDE